MRKAASFTRIAVVASATLALLPGEARAFGGSFTPGDGSQPVTGHRVAIALSEERTVVWDQMKYSGAPSELAWVMPVKPGARIEVATDAWLEALDAVTSVHVVRPGEIGCREPYHFMCSADDAIFGMHDIRQITSMNRAVRVEHGATVGPFAMEVAGAAAEVSDWLSEEGFAVSPAERQTLEGYDAEGYDFVRLTLRPDKGVQEMKPVRVITPGKNPVLPLRMASVGAGDATPVPVTLFVIAEDRYAADESGGRFANAQVPLDLLAWDFEERGSNYGELRAKTLGLVNGGAAWLTTYAQRRPFLSAVEDPLDRAEEDPLDRPKKLEYGPDRNGSTMMSIAEVYLNQGALNGEAGSAGGAVDVAACARAIGEIETDDAVEGLPSVVDPCPGLPLGDPACGAEGEEEDGEEEPGKLDARRFACGALDDLAVALIGMHPAGAVLTRLEAELPRAALDGDLALVEMPVTSHVDHWIRARVSVNVETFCENAAAGPGGAWRGERGGGSGGGAGPLFLAWFGALALVAAVGRRLARPAWADSRGA